MQKIIESVNEIYLTEGQSDIENYIRDTLSGNPRETDLKAMLSVYKKSNKKVKDKDFERVWKSLIKDGYLVKNKNDLYSWE